MATNIETDDEIMEMPGSTFRNTWEVTEVADDEVTLKLVDKAVGYVTDDVEWTVDRDVLAEAVDDNGVLTADIVKRAPDWEREIDQ